MGPSTGLNNDPEKDMFSFLGVVVNLRLTVAQLSRYMNRVYGMKLKQRLAY